jgi:hypothetical protein
MLIPRKPSPMGTRGEQIVEWIVAIFVKPGVLFGAVLISFAPLDI